MNLYSALYYKPFITKVLRYGPCVTRGSHGFTYHPHTNHTCLYAFTPQQPQGITTLWLVLIAPTHEGMARLS